jgi:hypothetical protein
MLSIVEVIVVPDLTRVPGIEELLEAVGLAVGFVVARQGLVGLGGMVPRGAELGRRLALAVGVGIGAGADVADRNAPESPGQAGTVKAEPGPTTSPPIPPLAVTWWPQRTTPAIVT